MASLKSTKAAAPRTTTSGSPAGAAKGRRSSSRSTTQGVTNRHLIEIKVWSDIPSDLLAEVRSQLGSWALADDDDELMDWFSTDLHKKIDARTTPGSWLRELRDAHGWTQKDLGIRLGDVSPARISDWENGHRSISKEIAKQLSELFRISADRFLYGAIPVR